MLHKPFILTRRMRKRSFVTHIIFCCLIGLLSTFLFSSSNLHANYSAYVSRPIISHPIRRLVTNNTAIYTPLPISLSNKEIANPLRGAQYASSEAPPAQWPLTDTYKRWCWSDLEVAQGVYNFSLIDNALAKAQANGYTFGFRIMPTNPSVGGSCIPTYLMNMLTKGFYESGTYIPDYNDPIYLTRAQALFQALGARYNNDPRLGLMDMSLYGCWGEWNEACAHYPSETGAIMMTETNREQLIDMQVQALSHKRFVMLTKHQDSLDYALSLHRQLPIGVRVDCLGTSTLGGAKDRMDNDPLVLNRWKIAPVYFEYCRNPDFQQALSDIKKYHASLIGDGDGNLLSFDRYDPLSQYLLQQSYEISGYRIQLDSFSISNAMQAGKSFVVTTQWSNVNVAPIYMPWNILIELHNANGGIVWQGVSGMNLQTLLPTANGIGKDSPVSFSDTFALPVSLQAGTYQFSIRIIDPLAYYHSLQLAIQGRQPNGSYVLNSTLVKA